MAFISFCSVFSSSVLLLILILFLPLNTISASESIVSSYIVHTNSDARPTQFSSKDVWYNSMIDSLTDHKTKPVTGGRIFYRYAVVFDGFAARLTNQEAEKIANIPGVTSVLKDRATLRLHTTRSPGFLGLNVNYGLWPDTNFGENVIIGLVDTGIWPESESFSDRGLGPIPPGWKGACEEGTLFNSSNCNKKLIGARYFLWGFENSFGVPPESTGDYRSPRDGIGHGTHTASTAAGAEVAHADLFGFANGTAQGIATKARIAMYKACTEMGCFESDITAAMESAIKDGVNVLSLSLGGLFDQAYYSDVIAVGAFAAVKKNIFVTCSAGNSGPSPRSVVNTAPWITTVGAGSIDRTFPMLVLLGNGKTFIGSSLYFEKINATASFPLVYIEQCSSNSIVPDTVMGKIVVCDSTLSAGNGFLVEAAGGVGLIEVTDKFEGEGLMAIAFTLPAATVGYREGLEILSYINTTENPTARFRFEKQTIVGKDRASILASFSSRGPNIIASEILKPDLIAPGFNILAAWVPNIAPTMLAEDPRRVNFNILSGTSMSNPHVAGVAALLHAAHPNWSPAAIRSALMTTSATIDNIYRPIAEFEDLEQAASFGLGAGHINPQLAADPGLIYDADINDYFKFLCSLNYTKEQIKKFVDGSSSCSESASGPGDLNYPSFSVVFESYSSIQVLKRTVTNVGEQLPEVYRVRIINPRPDKVTISVDPQTLIFNKTYEKQSYTVTFKRAYVDSGVFGHIVWESDRHTVRSPVVVN